MAPFRRPGLQDDDDDGELRPDTLRPRPFPSMRGQGFSAPTNNRAFLPTHSYTAGDEDSVVSGLSAMSDLESIYVEASSKNRPRDAREHYLLAQRLPGQKAASRSSSSGKGRSSTTLLNGFINESDGEEDDWQDMIYAATLRGPRKQQAPPKQQQRIDPVEQEKLDMNRAIAESRLQHEREQERKQIWMAQILEGDESPEKEKKGSKQSKRSSKKREKSKNPRRRVEDAEKPKKKGAWWDLKSKRT